MGLFGFVLLSRKDGKRDSVNRGSPNRPRHKEEPVVTKTATYKIGDYELSQEVLGSGLGGKIVRTLHIPSGVEFAVKMVSFHEPENKLRFENEARIFHACKFIEQVIPTQNSFTHESHGFICMKLFDSSLQSLLKTKQRLSTRRTVRYFTQICNGVSQLHQKNIAHLNLNSQTLLLCLNEGRIYLSDFGNSFFLESEKLGTGLYQLGARGIPTYNSPEANQAGSFYDPIAADLWSMGVILFVMLTGYVPKDNESVLENLALVEGLIVPDGLDLLQKILVIEPKRRVSIEGMLSHPFMNQADQEKRFPLQKIRRLLGGR